jgi:hypothetical protein
VFVVLPVLGRPPQDAALRRRLAHDCHKQLSCPARLVRPVRKVAVVAGRNGKHPDEVQDGTQQQRSLADTGPKNAKARKMHQHERDAAGIDDVVVAMSMWHCLLL